MQNSISESLGRDVENEPGIQSKVIYFEGKISYITFEESKEVIWILNIETKKEFRNKGYAKQLINYLKSKDKFIYPGAFEPDGEKYLKKYFIDSDKCVIEDY